MSQVAVKCWIGDSANSYISVYNHHQGQLSLLSLSGR